MTHDDDFRLWREIVTLVRRARAARRSRMTIAELPANIRRDIGVTAPPRVRPGSSWSL
ncbi:hypothetical protein GTW25_09810 [Aliihoeflea aestuarii]|jgi:hypothetical protein|uniref:hypothetical protein n=1 Tax=Aliihoeflea aestuarii TaxID=453840 RepID=UPI002092B3B2|nr:hypothetical protein [Aliihoeflea aestuarii]MCO6391322.1 hypothetical protein [Aliihoeflea aestuarii]